MARHTCGVCFPILDSVPNSSTLECPVVQLNTAVLVVKHSKLFSFLQ